MTHFLSIVGRVLAFAVAAIAFYMAFFLYENEEKQLRDRIQERLDTLWLKVYDRSKITDTTATALFNSVSEIINDAFDYLFGEKLLSARSVVASVTLSLAAVAMLAGIVTLLGFTKSHRWIGMLPLGLSFGLLLGVNMTSEVKSRWGILFSLVPSSAVLFILCSALIRGMKLEGVTYASHRGGISLLNPYTYPQVVREGVAVMVLAIVLSFVADVFAIILTRKSFSIVAKSLSLQRVITAIVVLVLTVAAIEAAPFIVVGLVHHWHPELRGLFDGSLLESSARATGTMMIILNVSTVLYLLAPILLLLAILLQKVMWPALSRIIYALRRYPLATNRKLLVSVGSLSLLLALNIVHLGVQELLKLLS